MSDNFRAVSERLVGAAFGDHPLSEADYESVRSALSRILLARYRALGSDEILEVVDETIGRLFVIGERGSDRIEQPSAWLVRVASNLSHDRLRRLRHEAPLAPEPVSDDETAQLLDHDASERAIVQAMREAIRQRDHVAVRVVQTWLDVAQESGVAPSSRTVGTRCGYSHTTVNEALVRFRAYMAQPPL